MQSAMGNNGIPMMPQNQVDPFNQKLGYMMGGGGLNQQQPQSSMASQAFSAPAYQPYQPNQSAGFSAPTQSVSQASMAYAPGAPAGQNQAATNIAAGMGPNPTNPNVQMDPMRSAGAAAYTPQDNMNQLHNMFASEPKPNIGSTYTYPAPNPNAYSQQGNMNQLNNMFSQEAQARANPGGNSAGPVLQPASPNPTQMPSSGQLPSWGNNPYALYQQWQQAAPGMAQDNLVRQMQGNDQGQAWRAAMRNMGYQLNQNPQGAFYYSAPVGTAPPGTFSSGVAALGQGNPNAQNMLRQSAGLPPI